MHDTTAFRWVRRIGLTVLSVVVGLPLFVILSTSIKPLADVQGTFTWLPRHITLTPYRDMWTTIPLGRYLTNSLVVATGSTVLAMLFGVPAAYAIARSRGRGPHAFGLLLLATQGVPGMLFLLPLFLIYAKIGQLTDIKLIGTYPGLIITDLTFALPLTIWLLTTHIAALPVDVEDAARVDGASELAVLVRVVVPIAAPGIGAAGVFAFLTAWGEVLFATILTENRTQTVPVGLQGYANQTTVYWNELTAAALTTSIPLFVAVLLLRRLRWHHLFGASRDRSMR
jgi:multiple sugar transport system permease protein